MSTRFGSGPPINNNKHRERFFKRKNISRPLDSKLRWKPQLEVVSRRNAKCDWYVDRNWQLCMDSNWMKSTSGQQGICVSVYLFYFQRALLYSSITVKVFTPLSSVLHWIESNQRSFMFIKRWSSGRFFRKANEMKINDDVLMVQL